MRTRRDRRARTSPSSNIRAPPPAAPARGWCTPSSGGSARPTASDSWASAPASAGAGMVHPVVWRVGSTDALDFWAERLGVEREGDVVRFADPEGLRHE